MLTFKFSVVEISVGSKVASAPVIKPDVVVIEVVVVTDVEVLVVVLMVEVKVAGVIEIFWNFDNEDEDGLLGLEGLMFETLSVEFTLPSNGFVVVSEVVGVVGVVVVVEVSNEVAAFWIVCLFSSTLTS
jgi:hypothetical protein